MIINVEGKLYDVTLIYKPLNKHIYFRFRDGIINIYTYKLLKESDIIKLIKSLPNIDKLLEKSIKNVSNKIHFKGLEYDINIILSNENKVLVDDKFNIFTKKNDDEYIFKIVHNFYASYLSDYLNKNIDRILMQYTDILDSKPTFEIKYLKTAYGLCRKRINKVTLSTILAKYNDLYIDSVIYHELCHFKYSNHQKAFYDYYESKFRNAKIIQHKLKQIKYNDKF